MPRVGRQKAARSLRAGSCVGFSVADDGISMLGTSVGMGTGSSMPGGRRPVLGSMGALTGHSNSNWDGGSARIPETSSGSRTFDTRQLRASSWASIAGGGDGGNSLRTGRSTSAEKRSLGSCNRGAAARGARGTIGGPWCSSPTAREANALSGKRMLLGVALKMTRRARAHILSCRGSREVELPKQVMTPAKKGVLAQKGRWPLPPRRALRETPFSQILSHSRLLATAARHHSLHPQHHRPTRHMHSCSQSHVLTPTHACRHCRGAAAGCRARTPRAPHGH